MLSYYTTIILITMVALLVLCVLVHDNTEISKKQKNVFYLTYLLICLAAASEWAGIQLSGHDTISKILLLTVKCADYILTPMAGGAMVRQLGLRNRGFIVLNIILIGNTLFQIIASFFGWMTVIDENNHYSHGSLYFVYVIIYLLVIAVVIVEFLIYGKGFPKQNRKSLYSVMALVLIGILMQEILGGEYRTAYVSMAFGAAFLYIHYFEYSQIDANEHINKQRELLQKDSMTGLFSHYAYSMALKKYDAAGTLPADLAAFSIDINGLKVTNDTFGHIAGDELICGAAQCIRKVFGSYGECYRTGGDEFIVLAHSDRALADDLIHQLAQKTAGWNGKLIHKLSLSAGYALAKDHDVISAEKLIVYADKGMYADKKQYYQRPENNRRTVTNAYP